MAGDRRPDGGIDHLVFTVHGIRTYGDWQERLERATRIELASRGDGRRLEFCNYKYGIFSVLALWFPPTRRLVARRFRREYDAIVAAHAGVRRVDVLAHSFGTYVAAVGLARDISLAGPKISNLVLAASVLPLSHDWRKLVPGRVERVVSECGWRDSILVLNALVNPLLGAAGRLGFRTTSYGRFLQRFFPFGHGDYFDTDDSGGDERSFMGRRWVPLILGGTDEALEAVDTRPRRGAAGTTLEFLLGNAELAKLALAGIIIAGAAAYPLALHRASERALAAELAVRARSVAAGTATPATAATVSTLALEAWSRQPSSEAWNALQRLSPLVETKRVARGDADSSARVRFSPDRSVLAIVRDYEGVRFVAADGRRLARWDVFGRILEAEFGRDGRWLAVITAMGSVRVFDIEGVRERFGAEGGAIGLGRIAVRPQHDQLAYSRQDGVAVISAIDGAVERVLPIKGPISGMEWSPDGGDLVVAGLDGVLIARGGGQEASVEVDVALVNGLAMSPDGRVVITAGHYGITMLDRLSGGRLGGAPRPPGLVQANILQVSADGRWVLAWDNGSNEAVVASLPDGSSTVPIVHEAGISATALSSDGRYVATGTLDGEVRVLSLPDGKEVLARTLESGPSVISGLAFLPEIGALLVATYRGARLISFPSGTEMAFIEGDVEGVDVAPGSGLMLALGGRHGAQIVRLSTGPQAARLNHARPVARFDFSPDERWVASCADDGSVMLASLEGSATALTVEAGGGAPAGAEPLYEPAIGFLGTCAFTPDSRYLVASVAPGGTRFFDLSTRKVARKVEHHGPHPAMATFSRSGSVTALLDGSATALMVDPADPARDRTFAMQEQIGDVSLSDDGRYVALTNTRAVTEVRSLAEDRVVATFEPEGNLPQLTYQEFRFAEGGRYGIWALNDEITIRDLDADKEVFAASFAADIRYEILSGGRVIVAARRDGSAVVLRLGTGEVLAEGDIGSDSWGLTAVAGGDLLVSLRGAESVQLVDPRDLSIVRRWRVNGVDEYPRTDLAGTMLAVQDLNEVRLLSVQAGEELLRVSRPSKIRYATVSASGRWLGIGDEDGSTQVWSTDPEDLIRSVCRSQVGPLGPEEWRAWLGDLKHRTPQEQCDRALGGRSERPPPFRVFEGKIGPER